MNTIKIGQTLTARSIGDSECIFSAEITGRNKSFVTVRIMGAEKRVKIFTGDEGEYIYALGRYSMSPMFKAIN